MIVDETTRDCTQVRKGVLILNGEEVRGQLNFRRVRGKQRGR